MSFFRPGYSIRDPYSTYFLTATVVDWIELFIRPQLADIVVDSLAYCHQNKGLDIHAWCLMPNHLHLMCTHKEGRLPDVLRDFKRHTASAILKMLKDNELQESRKRWLLQRLEIAALGKRQDYKLWQSGNHPVVCDSSSFFEQRLRYVHENPVKAGFVWEPQHYRYSSAIDYWGGTGLLPLVMDSREA